MKFLQDRSQFVRETRPEGVQQKRDCTVRAFSSATGKAYAEVFEAFKAEGRMENRGCRLKDIAHKVASRLGVSLTMVKRSGTLGKFLASNPSGIFIVRVAGHAFAVKNGVVFDLNEQSPMRQIKSAWRVMISDAGPETENELTHTP